MICTSHAAYKNVRLTEQVHARDGEMAAAVQAGSPAAFAELYADYSPRLYRTILHITKSPEDAEDALQETFLHAYLGMHTFEGRASLYSWMTRIAINSALMILRKRRIRSEILFDPQPEFGSEPHFAEFTDSAPNPEQVYELQQRSINLSHAIGGLDDHLRVPLQMQMAQGSPIKEIGRALNLSEAAVKTRLHRARLQLSTHSRQRKAKVPAASIAIVRRET